MEEVACGCIPWRVGQNKKVEVLVILRTGGFWEFPKGKREENESDIETAKRELKEETGLTGDVVTDKVIEYEYVFNRNDIRIEKKVRLFMCHVADISRVKIQKSEVSDYSWLSIEDVVQRVTYPETKEVARRACKLIQV